MSQISVSQPKTRRDRPSHRTGTGSTPANPPAAKGKAKAALAIRRRKVERAKKLLQDPNYPSPKVIGAVARLLARKWEKAAPKSP